MSGHTYFYVFHAEIWKLHWSVCSSNISTSGLGILSASWHLQADGDQIQLWAEASFPNSCSDSYCPHWQGKCAVRMNSSAGQPLASGMPAVAECPTPHREGRSAVRGGFVMAVASSAAGDRSSPKNSSAVGEPRRGWHTATFQVRGLVCLSGDGENEKQRGWEICPTY